MRVRCLSNKTVLFGTEYARRAARRVSTALTVRKPAWIGHALSVLCSLRTVMRVDDLAADHFATSSATNGRNAPSPRGRPFSSATGRDLSLPVVF
jgi:hypothetical protein